MRKYKIGDKVVIHELEYLKNLYEYHKLYYGTVFMTRFGWCVLPMDMYEFTGRAGVIFMERYIKEQDRWVFKLKVDGCEIHGHYWDEYCFYSPIKTKRIDTGELNVIFE